MVVRGSSPSSPCDSGSLSLHLVRRRRACASRPFGGRFGGVRFIKPWHDYFPHVDSSELRLNFHQRLDALQGRKRTYMVGEVFNLPLVSECVDWARYLVRRHFKPAGGAGGGKAADGGAGGAVRRLRLFTRVPRSSPTPAAA